MERISQNQKKLNELLEPSQYHSIYENHPLFLKTYLHEIDLDKNIVF